MFDLLMPTFKEFSSEQFYPILHFLDVGKFLVFVLPHFVYSLITLQDQTSSAHQYVHCNPLGYTFSCFPHILFLESYFLKRGLKACGFENSG